MGRPVVLIIRDGWGLNEKQEGNAVAAANTTNTDYYKRKRVATRYSVEGGVEASRNFQINSFGPGLQKLWKRLPRSLLKINICWS